MYYQPDLSYSHRIFKLLLLVSIAFHGVILFYQKSGKVLHLSTPSLLNATSIQVQLREMPVIKSKVVTPKKTKLKPTKKKITKDVAKKYPPKETIQETPAGNPKRAFKSFINNFVHPHYPRLAKRRGITGTVELVLLVQGNGQLKEVKLAQSSGNQLLDQSALDAAKQWTFGQISSEKERVYELSKTIIYKIN